MVSHENPRPLTPHPVLPERGVHNNFDADQSDAEPQTPTSDNAASTTISDAETLATDEKSTDEQYNDGRFTDAHLASGYANHAISVNNGINMENYTGTLTNGNPPDGHLDTHIPFTRHNVNGVFVTTRTMDLNVVRDNMLTPFSYVVSVPRGANQQQHVAEASMAVHSQGMKLSTKTPSENMFRRFFDDLVMKSRLQLPQSPPRVVVEGPKPTFRERLWNFWHNGHFAFILVAIIFILAVTITTSLVCKGAGCATK